MTESLQTLTPEQIKARREANRTWWGYLADDNVEHVAQRIRTMLEGRRYTFVATNVEFKSTVPEVRTSQRLEPEKAVDKVSPRVHRIGDLDWEDKPGTSCSIVCCDTYGVWGIHSDYATEREAREDANKGHENRCVYVHIDGGLDSEHLGRNDQIQITQWNYMSPRERLQWVIAPEHDDMDW